MSAALAITENTGKAVVDADMLISLSRERTEKDIITNLIAECDKLRRENIILKSKLKSFIIDIDEKLNKLKEL